MTRLAYQTDRAGARGAQWALPSSSVCLDTVKFHNMYVSLYLICRVVVELISLWVTMTWHNELITKNGKVSRIFQKG